jgi:hypothetical protein
MSWFMRRSVDGLAKAERESPRGLVSGKTDVLAVFGLAPTEPCPTCHRLFAREVHIAPAPKPEDWESVHLYLM